MKHLLIVILLIATFYVGVLAISNMYTAISEHVDYSFQAKDPNYTYKFSAYNAPTYSEYLLKKEEYKNEYIAATPYIAISEYCPIKYGKFDSIGCGESIIATNSQNAIKDAEYFKYDISSYDNINVQPYFSGTYKLELYNWKILKGVKPVNFEEIAIDSLAASILFPGEKLDDIIGKKIKLDMKREEKQFDSVEFTVTAVYQYVPFRNNNFEVVPGELRYNPLFLTEYPNFDTYQYKDNYLKILEEADSFQSNIFFEGIKTGAGINSFDSKDYSYEPNYLALKLSIIQFIIFIFLLLTLMFSYFKYFTNRVYYLVFIPIFALVSTIYSVNTLQPTILVPIIGPIMLFCLINIGIFILYLACQYVYKFFENRSTIKN